MAQVSRRIFVGRSIQGEAIAAAANAQDARTAAVGTPNEKVVLALIGAGGRGTHVIGD
jgi:hypothetical protein